MRACPLHALHVCPNAFIPTCPYAYTPIRPNNARLAAWRSWSSGEAAAELGAVAPACGDCGGTTCIA